MFHKLDLFVIYVIDDVVIVVLYVGLTYNMYLELVDYFSYWIFKQIIS